MPKEAIQSNLNNLLQPAGFVERFKSVSQHSATIVSLGLLTFLWAEVRDVSSIIWTSLAAALMIAAVIANRGDQMDDRRVTKAFLLYFALYSAGMIFSYLFVSPFHVDRLPVLGDRFSAILLALIFYAFGVISSSPKSWPGFAIALAATTLYIVQSRGDFAVQELYRRYEEDEVNIGYQQLGDSLAICSLVLIGYFRQRSFVYCISALTIVLLFIVPSRSAAVFGSLALLLACLLVSTPKVRIALIALTLVAAVSARVWIVYNVTETLEGTRHETLLTKEEDSSNQERMEILEDGFKSIAANPIFGYFGFELDQTRERGRYIHNFLDVWAQAGILPWLALLLFWALIGRQWYFMYRDDRARAYRSLPFLMFALFSWLFSRSMTYPVLYFCVGYFSSVLAESIRSRFILPTESARPRQPARSARPAQPVQSAQSEQPISQNSGASRLSGAFRPVNAAASDPVDGSSLAKPEK
jgi:O-antigen ligase